MTENTSRRILLVNSWHDDNKGDSAITNGIIRLLKLAEPHASLTVVGLSEAGRLDESATRHTETSHPDLVTLPNPMPTELRTGRRSHPAIDIPIWIVRLIPSLIRLAFGSPASKMKSLLDDFDLVVAIGGSNLYSDRSVTPLLSMARLYTLAAPIHAAGKRDIPVLLLGHTLGPFPTERRATLRMARLMLRNADLVVLRDEASMPVARQLGVARAEVAPDMAYATVPVPTARVQKIAATLGTHTRRTAIISVRRHPSLGQRVDQRLLSELRLAAIELVRRDAIDSIVVVAHTIGPTEIEDDRGISAELAGILQASHVGVPIHYLDEDLASAELAWLYGQMSCMIAVRLHAAILAMILGTPVFAISYFEHKTSGVMADVGMSRYVGNFEAVTAREISDSIVSQLGSQTMRNELARACRQKREYLESRSRFWLSPTGVSGNSEALGDADNDCTK